MRNDNTGPPSISAEHILVAVAKKFNLYLTFEVITCQIHIKHLESVLVMLTSPREKPKYVFCILSELFSLKNDAY